MKSFLGIAYNFFKTVKSTEEDSNEEKMYAEANILFQETEYLITNGGNISKGRKVGELELMLTLEAAKEIRQSMDDIIEFLEKEA